MNKILTVMTGLGVGAVLLYVFDGAKRKPRGGSVGERAPNVVGDDEGVTGACPSFIRGRAGEMNDGARHGRAASRSGIAEDAFADDVVRLTGAEADESPQTDSALGSAHGPVSGGRLWDCGNGGSLTAAGSVWSLVRWIVPDAASGWRPVYRWVCRLSFRVCLCTAGLRIIRRLFGGQTENRAADFGRRKFSKREYVLVTGCAALAFLARLSLLRLRPTALTPDGVYYARLGKLLAAGNFREGLSSFWSPLYPLLTGLSSLVSREVELGGRLVSVLAGSLLVVPVYLLARSLYGEDAASVAALLIAVHPTLAHYSTLLLTESTYTLLFTTALLLGLTALSLSLLPWFAYTLTSSIPDRQLEHRRAGAWVKEHSETPALIMATAPYTAFYAGGKPLYLSAAQYPTVLEHARRHGVDYLVIDEEVISEGHWGHDEYAALRFLLDEQGRHPGLKLVYKFDGVPKRKILIFTLS